MKLTKKDYIMDITPRWIYRYNNYKKAFYLLQNALEEDIGSLSQLEKEGVIQRFEYTMELAWKSMKDYLEWQNILLSEITPRIIIRKAFEAKIITQGELWQEALDARNKMSHTYDFAEFEKVVFEIQQKYLAIFDELNEFFMERMLKNAT